MSKVLIIGGGAAGMMAAVAAGENGHDVWLYEKNDRLGRKLFITGKGRCNITNAGDMETLFASVMSNPKFLYSSFYTFTNDQVIDFFEELGVRTKIERGNRVFPLSDHSSDVIAGLKRKLETLGVHICLETEVEKIEERDGKFQAIVLKGGQRKTGDACIVATGGISYPATGSTGDGYRFAKENGHQITKLYPALVPMEVREWYAKELQGLSLRNVSAAVYDGETLGVHICLETEVEKIEERDGKFQAIVLKGGQRKTGDACIVATGGISYPATGSTGDGYRFAKENGHQITKLYPALVPMEVREWYAKELQGLSLRNVSAAVYDGKKKLYEDFGEMLFTHYGVSGPLMLSASSVIGKRLSEKELCLVIDLKPALTAEQLDARVLREFEEHKNKQFKNAVDHLFPSKLKPVMLELSGISEEKKVNEISREERQRFVHLIKHFEMTLSGLRSYKEAIITKGGVNVKEIDPGTMESKKISGLYFVGEVLDLDALTGGFNLQIAWSTAYLAGISIP